MGKQTSRMARRTRWAAVLGAVWRTIRATRIGAPTLAMRLRALPGLVSDTLGGRYGGLSRGRLAVYAAAVAYILSPIDLVPEGLLWFLGLADDAAVAAWLVSALLLDTERYLASATAAGSRSNPGTVIPGEVLHADQR